MSDTAAGRPAPSQRLSAVVALAALAVAVAVVVIGVASNLGFVLIGVACLAVLGLAGWYAVSRSGPVRVAALVVGGVSLVALIVLVFTGDLSGWRVAGGLAAIAVSVAAARKALGPEPPAQPVVLGDAAAARPVLLMNPRSGGGKVEKFHLPEECRKRGIEPIVLQQGDDLAQLAEQAIESGADVVGMAGGDGSQALVAGLASRHGLPMVVIPAGTRNHFALDIGLDRMDVVGALEAYTHALERRVDLAMVEDRVFVNNASMGIYARIVQSPGYRDAKIQTTAAMLPEMLGPKAEPFDLRFTGPDGAEHPSAHLVMVSNNPYQLESLTTFGTREHMDGGVLGIASATIRSAAEWQQLLALQATGHMGRFRGLLQWAAPTFEIRSEAPVEIGIDGEALVMEPPLRFRSMPAALRLRLPPGAPGPPAAQRRPRLLARSAVVGLGRVAAGRQPGGIASTPDESPTTPTEVHPRG